MIGELIKEFRITARLGRGGMGEVWAAEQQIIKTKVAIKLLLADASNDKQLVQRFFNEAVAVSKIKHAGIVKIYDVGFHGESAYLIMELLEGESLASRIRRSGRLPIGQVGDAGRQMASILDATHAAGIVHRDLKPDNIFLVQDAELASGERVKILDFGIAKLGGATGLTGTGGSMGTPAYMAPEQWTDAAKADARADVYSVGCVAFEMCCGRPPFIVSSIPEAFTKHLTETPPRASSLISDVPHDLDDVIARALAKQPAERPTMKEIGAVFAGIAASHPGVLASTLHDIASAAPRASAQARSDSLAAVPTPVVTTLRGAASAARVDTRSPGKRMFVVIGLVIVAGATAIAISRRGSVSEPSAAAPPPPALVASLPQPPQPVDSLTTKPSNDQPSCRDSVSCLTACEASNAQACYLLASMYLNGVGLPADRAKALVFFRKACVGAHQEGCNVTTRIELEDNATREKARISAAAARAKAREDRERLQAQEARVEVARLTAEAAQRERENAAAAEQRVREDAEAANKQKESARICIQGFHQCGPTIDSNRRTCKATCSQEANPSWRASCEAGCGIDAKGENANCFNRTMRCLKSAGCACTSHACTCIGGDFLKYENGWTTVSNQ